MFFYLAHVSHSLLLMLLLIVNYNYRPLLLLSFPFIYLFFLLVFFYSGISLIWLRCATSKSDSGVNTNTSVRVLRSQSRQLKKTKTGDACEKTLLLALSKSDSGITRHLKTSPECRNAVCSNPVKEFRVLAKARNSGHLCFLEAVFISRLSPVLCAQKEFVRRIALF